MPYWHSNLSDKLRQDKRKEKKGQWVSLKWRVKGKLNHPCSSTLRRIIYCKKQELCAQLCTNTVHRTHMPMQIWFFFWIVRAFIRKVLTNIGISINIHPDSCSDWQRAFSNSSTTISAKVISSWWTTKLQLWMLLLQRNTRGSTALHNLYFPPFFLNYVFE